MPGLPGMLPFPGMPGLPPLPGMPGLPGAPGMMMPNLDPDALATLQTQQQALDYEAQKMNSGSVEPEVMELAQHFGLSDRHTRLLDEQLKKRNNTFEEDIASMYEILKGAKNPADLLMVSIRWMSEGVFRGTLTPNPEVERVAKMYKLDAPSACKLAEILETRKDPDDDLRKISSHLERSNKPSSLVMMMLKDLKNGKEVEECKKQPAIGSYIHQQELKKQQKNRSRSRRGGRRSRDRRSRSRGGGGGGGGRGRSRSRKRSRSRRRRSGSRGR